MSRYSEAIPRLPKRRTARAGAREPRREQRGGGRTAEKEAAAPAKMPRRRGATRGKAPGEGPAHPGRGLSHPVLGFPRPSRRRLRTLRGYSTRSARNNSPPSCCIANKILMSPLPLPFGRLLRSARGAGSSASRTVPGSPVRSGPCPRRLSASLAAGPRPHQLLSRPLPVSGRAFSWGLRETGEKRAERAASRSQSPCSPHDLKKWGQSSSGGLSLPFQSTQLSPFPPTLLPLPSSRPALRPPPQFPFTLSAVYCLSPPRPLLAFGLGISSLFITYFDPASLCPRFLRKFYCPRSRVFD